VDAPGLGCWVEEQLGQGCRGSCAQQQSTEEEGVLWWLSWLVAGWVAS